MVPEVVTSVWVDEHGQGAPIHSQPSKQGACLVRREGIDFEHGHRVRTNWFLTEAKNHELWEFPSNSLVELSCKLGFVLVASVVVDMKIKVGTVRKKRFRGLVPTGRLGTRCIFQRSSIRVKLDGERIARTLIILEGRRPLFWHGRLAGSKLSILSPVRYLTALEHQAG